MSERVGGTIKVGWSISEKDLGIDGIRRALTSDELRAMYDRIEAAVIEVVDGLSVDVYVDGEKKPPVRVDVDLNGNMHDLEIDDGPVVGLLSDLRDDLEMQS